MDKANPAGWFPLDQDVGRKNEQQRFHEGILTDGWRYFGAHPDVWYDKQGWRFRTWAPRAWSVSVVGEFNNWDETANVLTRNGELWEGFIPGLNQYDAYKFAIRGADGKLRLKADPYAFHAETRPATASKLYDISGFQWTDADFRRRRKDQPVYESPLNIYEVHLGSWRLRDNGDFIDYRDLARMLAPYVQEMGYTAIELLPVTEHPLDASWGYQCTGYFAPTSRYGTPHDFMWFVNYMHEHGILVILDWVPAHFCKDEQGLYQFDGLPCYEYTDPNKWEHASWGTRVFDYGRPEVCSFLYSSARFWLDEYHIDGIRVDAVASMLYLDYDRGNGGWTPNKYGGNHNLEAIRFLQGLNAMAFQADPNVLMIAEESTAWPNVTKPPAPGDPDSEALGFNLKWNMGWMNDMCHYLKLDPWFRQDHHKDITFSMMYAFSENYVLPISHDEIVHMKGSVVGKMPGDYKNQLRCTRGFYSYLLAHPGKKLLFMGAEIGQWNEWHSEQQLDWYLLDQNEENRQLHQFFKDANAFYRRTRELWEVDFNWTGFEWLVPDDNHNNVVIFLRRDKSGKELLCAINFSPNNYDGYRVGVPEYRKFVPLFTTDDPIYGGADFYDKEAVAVEEIPSHNRDASIAIKIPAFGAVFLRGEGTLVRKKRKEEAKPKRKTTRGAAKAAAESEGAANTPASAKAAQVPASDAAEPPKRKRRGRSAKKADTAEN